MPGILVGLACALTWATGSVLMKELSKKLDPFTLNAPRLLVGGTFMFILAAATGRTAGYQDVTGEKLFFLLFSMIVGGGIGDSLYVLSMARIGVSRAFPIANTYPALTLLFGLLFLNEQITWPIVAGLVLVLGGIMVISRSTQNQHNETPLAEQKTGLLFALGASVLWAASMALVAPGMEGLDPITVASFRTPALALIFWGIVALRGTWRKLLKLAPREWVILFFGGLIGWGLGSVLFLSSVTLLGATRAAIVTSTSPLFALPLCAIFLKEKLNGWVLVGSVLTVAGIVLVS